MLNNLKYILMFILSLRRECLLPFILQILFFCCHFNWLAGFINPDRWKNVVRLVSPYKCSPLIKLKFCSLSVNLISLPFCIAGQRSWIQKLLVCFCLSRLTWSVYLFTFNHFPPLIEDLWRRIYLWHTAGRKASRTPDCDKAAGPVGANIWSCFPLWLVRLSLLTYFLNLLAIFTNSVGFFYKVHLIILQHQVTFSFTLPTEVFLSECVTV